MGSESSSAALAELNTQKPLLNSTSGSKQQGSNGRPRSGKHKKQKTVVGAAEFPAEEVAHRKAKWEARQASPGMQSLQELRSALPTAARRYNFLTSFCG